MATIYVNKNYIVQSGDGVEQATVPVISSYYTETEVQWEIFNSYVPFKSVIRVVKADIADYEDIDGNPYSDAIFTEFLRTNTSLIDSRLLPSSTIVINNASDFPTPVAGVITLEANKTYIIQKPVDLLGDRLVAGGVCNLFGTSSETSYLTSTGLGVGVPLLTSLFTIVLENITFHDVDTCLDIDGNTNLVALDWENVNFADIPNVGTINTCDNFIYETGAFLSSNGLLLTGTIGTVGVSNSLFVSDSLAENVIELDASCVITRRFRIIYSSFVIDTLATGISVNVSATIPTESYILDTVNFAGAGTYISGVTQTSNDSLFINCKGISNTAVNGQLYMQGNATATTIAGTSTFVKVAGTTTASADNSKISHSNNRLTIDAVISRKYLIQCHLSFTSGNNNECEFGFYDSQLVGIRTPSRTKSTANSAGRAENVSFACVVNADLSDYLEIWCANNSAITNITVTDMNFIITEIK
jgi:hypothetical protein